MRTCLGNFFYAKNFRKQILVKITKCMKWHTEGEVMDKDLAPVEVDPLYFVDADEALKVKKGKKEDKWRFNMQKDAADCETKGDGTCGVDCDCTAGADGKDGEMLDGVAGEVEYEEKEVEVSEEVPMTKGMGSEQNFAMFSLAVSVICMGTGILLMSWNL